MERNRKGNEKKVNGKERKDVERQEREEKGKKE